MRGKNSRKNQRRHRSHGHFMGTSSTALQLPRPLGEGRGEGCFSLAFRERAEVTVQRRAASGVWFIFPAVFQKTVKTVKNG